MTQAMIAAGPAACAAYSAPKSQPEPMMELSDAQTAPMNPISRLRPTSVGDVTLAEPVSVAMIDSSFRFSIVPLRASHAPRGFRGGRVCVQLCRVRNIVETNITIEKS